MFATLGLEFTRPAAGQLLGSLADEAARLAERALREYGDSAATPTDAASGGDSTGAAPSPASQRMQPIPKEPLNNMTVPLDQPLNQASMPVSRETGSSAPTRAAVPAAKAAQTPVRIHVASLLQYTCMHIILGLPF